MDRQAAQLNKSWLTKTVGWQLLLLAVFLLMAGSTQEDFSSRLKRLIPEAIPLCSSYNDKASGYKALYELCQKVGLPTKRWARAYRDLNGTQGCLLIVAPKYPFKEHDLENILEWVKKGNDLVYVDYFQFHTGQKLLDQLNLTIQRANSKYSVNIKVAPNSKNPELEHVQSFDVSAWKRIEGGTPLLADEQGSLIVETKYGLGRCLIASTPGMCANIKIRDPQSKGNFQFLINWLAKKRGTIFFEEKSHGYTAVENVFSHLARSPVGYVSFQLMLVFFVALFSFNQRFGPLKQTGSLRKLSNLEFIDGLASTYRKAKAYDAAWLILFTSLKSRLCRALGVMPEDSAAVLSAAWSEATGLRQEELCHFLEQSAGLIQKGKVSQEELLASMALYDKYFALSKDFIAISGARRLGS